MLHWQGNQVTHASVVLHSLELSAAMHSCVRIAALHCLVPCRSTTAQTRRHVHVLHVLVCHVDC
jgi:hypothetical protein